MYLHEIMLIWTNIGFKCFNGAQVFLDQNIS